MCKLQRHPEKRELERLKRANPEKREIDRLKQKKRIANKTPEQK